MSEVVRVGWSYEGLAKLNSPKLNSLVAVEAVLRTEISGSLGRWYGTVRGDLGQLCLLGGYLVEVYVLGTMGRAFVSMPTKYGVRVAEAELVGEGPPPFSVDWITGDFPPVSPAVAATVTGLPGGGVRLETPAGQSVSLGALNVAVGEEHPRSDLWGRLTSLTATAVPSGALAPADGGTATDASQLNTYVRDWLAEAHRPVKAIEIHGPGVKWHPTQVPIGRPRRSVVEDPLGWRVTDSDFRTSDRVLAVSVAADLDQVDPLPCPHDEGWQRFDRMDGRSRWLCRRGCGETRHSDPEAGEERHATGITGV